MKELHTAFLALAVYCGELKLESLVGAVVPDALRAQASRCGAVTLVRRVDLRQHFIVSVAFKIASDSGRALAVGEFKELLDANRGCSGFSFDDIAADRAGIRFAKILAAKAGDPAIRDRLLKLSAEAPFSPSVEDLPSNMPEA